MPDTRLPDQRARLLDEFESELAEGDSAGAAQCLRALQRMLPAGDAELLYARARFAWVEQGQEAALPTLQQVVTLDPRHSDAHYDLGRIAEQQGDRATLVRHFLRVRALDAEHDRDAGLGKPEHFDFIDRVAREVLDALPAPFAARLDHVPVMIERRPARALVEDGFDPRSFGLFEGPTEAMRDVPAPTRIVLFACNLLAEFSDPDTLAHQVELTLLHEIGHFFGLDEAELEELGLG
ncbi:MAG TPA: metallopeptidase family protein [Polyangiales bacterium]|jgi:predicted Zn-dependent protease with MMP-like domain|nr:metallopeptidase family protein [Polyangiales bacterium]